MKVSAYLTIVLLMGACSKMEYNSNNSKQLARVGNYYLTFQEARNAIPDFVMQQDSMAAIQAYAKSWVQKKIILKEAHKIQLAGNESVQKKLQNAREQVLVHALRNIIIARYADKTSVSDEEAMRYFQNNRQQFVLQERYVKFRHVTTDSVKYARAARQEILAGTTWPEVANLYSENADQRIKQSKKYWPVSVVLNEFPVLEQYLAELDSGQTSPVRRLQGKYHFIQLIGAREVGEMAKPEWLIDQLKDWIMLDKKQQFFNSYLKNLYLNAIANNEAELYNVKKQNKP